MTCEIRDMDCSKANKIEGIEPLMAPMLRKQTGKVNKVDAHLQ